MEKKLYQHADLEILERDGKFYARYDAGMHQIVMREDEITAEDARKAMLGSKEAEAVLLSLQQRLIASGVDPYKSNLPINSDG